MRKGGRVCAHEQCNRQAIISAGNADVCNKHYQRWLSTGDWSLPDRQARDTCAVKGCARKPRSKHAEYCDTHYCRKRRGKSSDWAALVRTHCDTCGEPLAKSHSRFCSVACSWKAQRQERRDSVEKRLKNSDINHRQRARKFGVEYEVPVDLLAICETSGFRCAVCGGEIDLEISYPDRDCLSIDHTVPLAAGGGHVAANIRPTHFRCNVEKAYKRDIPKAAKAKRQAGEKGQRARRNRAKAAGTHKAIPQRPNPWPPKGSRKLPSRKFGEGK